MEFGMIGEETKNALEEILGLANLNRGDIFVVGCSTSEVVGKRIGRGSNIKEGEAIFHSIYKVLQDRGIYIAAQCCEHLNRCIIIERDALAPWEEIVNVVPHISAGGAFATTAYLNFKDPVAVETVKADAGMDIGDTLIGMHLKKVAVPLRLKNKSIGKAHIVAARTRPKFVGGERASYDNSFSEEEVKK